MFTHCCVIKKQSGLEANRNRASNVASFTSTHSSCSNADKIDDDAFSSLNDAVYKATDLSSDLIIVLNLNDLKIVRFFLFNFIIYWFYSSFLSWCFNFRLKLVLVQAKVTSIRVFTILLCPRVQANPSWARILPVVSISFFFSWNKCLCGIS